MVSPVPIRRVAVPAAPALVVGHQGAVWLTPDGEALELDHAAAARRAMEEMPLVCHMPATARRLGGGPFRAFDVLELYAFARPARFCLPTPAGLGRALGFAPPGGLASEAVLLAHAAETLLAELAALDHARDPDAADLVRILANAGWPWCAAVESALGAAGRDAGHDTGHDGLRALEAWRRVVPWEEEAPEGGPETVAIHPAAVRARLGAMVGEEAEARPQQAAYAEALAKAFQPREREGEPAFLLAEAGTGVGKTLGYLAPATLWAEANGAPVWVSTYTRNLQHQVDGELDRLFPEPREKRRRVVVRKGRENYVCLLNFEELVRGAASQPQAGISAALMARWVAATRDGDMTGGDLPAWLVDILGHARTLGLADRRGECIYAACPHYQTCFIERSVRRARRADVVVANHALVMVQAALGTDDGRRPTRYVFDEGHHVFEAADAAFSAALTGLETRELRRWLLGSEGRSGSRARGLRRRLEDLLPADPEAEPLLEKALDAAHVLPAEGWLQRMVGGMPRGETERFLVAARTQVLARAGDGAGSYDLQCHLDPPLPELVEAATALEAALARIAGPLETLRTMLVDRLDQEADTLETTTRLRIEGIARSLRRRAQGQLTAWRAVLRSIGGAPDDGFVDWLSLLRAQGQERDVGLHRHWVDPTEPFARVVAEPAHGLVVTSATLRDATGEAGADWAAAALRTGARHMACPPIHVWTPSPFDYPAQTRVLVVTDVRRNAEDQVAAAYRELFRASGGGAIGLFTAIQRLRAVHERIAAPLEAAGLRLYAQHVDRVDVSTLVEIFRAETDTCLLGTDAVRDGVDVPGRSLRLIVFDRVPWPRPDILHRARRQAFGGRAWDDMLTRLRLRQAYGRLIRRRDDRGVFVMLDPQLPSRLAAFPAGVEVERVGLAEAVGIVRDFVGDGA